MVDFGEALRAERERRSMPLDVLCARTKVNPRYMEALERGDLLALPGGILRKGVVRAYLAALELEEAAWMPRFEASWQTLAQATGAHATNGGLPGQAEWETFAANVKRARGPGRQQSPLRWLGVLALFVLLAAAAWLVWRSVPAPLRGQSTPGPSATTPGVAAQGLREGECVRLGEDWQA